MYCTYIPHHHEIHVHVHYTYIYMYIDTIALKQTIHVYIFDTNCTKHAYYIGYMFITCTLPHLSESLCVITHGSCQTGEGLCYHRRVHAELPSRYHEQVGDLPIGHSLKWGCPQLTKFIAKLCELVGMTMPDRTLHKLYTCMYSLAHTIFCTPSALRKRTPSTWKAHKAAAHTCNVAGEVSA